MTKMHVFILAAGLGTRLRPITNKVPKALVEVGGVPMFKRWVDQLQDLPIDKLFFNSHYLASMLESYAEGLKSKFPLIASFEPEILGTGGGIYALRKELRTLPSLVINVDILTDYRLADFLDQAWQEDASLLAKLLVMDRAEDSKILISHQQMVGFEKNGQAENLQPALFPQIARGFCGIHLLYPSFFTWLDRLEKPLFSIMDIYRLALQQGYKIATAELGASFWLDIGTHQQLQQAEKANFL